MSARYPAIADHGIIGDLETAALVALDGTIDFLCLPSFDSPSVFLSLLDAERGGHFMVEALIANARREQRYLRDTNVLVTQTIGAEAEVGLYDFMPVPRRPTRSRVVRLARVTRGRARIRCVCAPRFDYARGSHSVAISGDSATFTSASGDRLRLTTTASLTTDGHDVVAEAELVAGEEVAFALEVLGGAEDSRVRRAPDPGRELRQTVVFWRRWIAKSRYAGEWRGMVRRSALTLKLLQSHRTGAIIAAPTFGLPEQIGGTRNWDFRYAWIRDSAFTVHALGRIGLGSEAGAFAQWVVDRCAEAKSPGELQSLYTIDGGREITEQTLDHLEGHAGSRPVRIGNAAYDQLQLDIYGELMDALHQRDEQGDRPSRALWNRIVELVDWVARNWRRADQGIWEVRSGCQEFLYSRLMCWVALDRALRMASRRRLPAPREEWRATREAIRADIDEHFWSSALDAFVGARGGDTVDAACLVMPLVGFIAPTDPRWRSTLRAVEARLVRDGMVRRYEMTGMDTDARSAEAPSFTVCSFWYVECLAVGGEEERARLTMKRLLERANHVGLYAEDLGVEGEQLGNFPQGLTHSALIGAAVALARLARK
jgi:GH15 family glucan-1,4-alpha-glucosidase